MSDDTLHPKEHEGVKVVKWTEQGGAHKLMLRKHTRRAILLLATVLGFLEYCSPDIDTGFHAFTWYGIRSPCSASAEMHQLSSKVRRTYPYLIRYRIEIDGDIHVVSMSRYYKFHDLAFDADARQEGDCLRYHIVGLRQEQEEYVNYGIGQGPRRHQRYVLLDHLPSEEELTRINAAIIASEKAKLGDAYEPVRVPATGSDEEARMFDEEEEHNGGASGDTFGGKKAYFNYYIWQKPFLGFSFCQAAGGSVGNVDNSVKLRPVSTPGGKRASPRFFEILAYGLLALPAFLDEPVPSASLSGSSWEVSTVRLIEGLVDLCREVYGRKMSIIHAEAAESHKVRYVGHMITGTPILKVTGSCGKGAPVGVRVSGLKGYIWIESLEREVLFDTSSPRILKDDLRVDFGIERDAKILGVRGRTNRIELLIADRCCGAGHHVDDELVRAYERCYARETVK